MQRKVLRYVCGMSKKAPQSLEKDLREFLEANLASLASAGFSDSVCVEICVEEEKFYFERLENKNQCKKSTDKTPDITFWLAEKTLRQILMRAKLPGTGLGTMGITIFDSILSKDESSKIKFKVRASILSLWAKGYFSVLKVGGPEVAAYLAKMGLGGISQMKELLKNIRG